MTNSENPQVVSSSRPIRERVGLIVDGANAGAAIKTIVAAEDAGVRQIWVARHKRILKLSSLLSSRCPTTSTPRIKSAHLYRKLLTVRFALNIEILFRICQAMSIAIATVFPLPVAIFVHSR